MQWQSLQRQIISIMHSLASIDVIMLTTLVGQFALSWCHRPSTLFFLLICATAV
jgi:hypothetical protein